MVARLVFPDEGSRLVYDSSSGRPMASTVVSLFTNSAGTTVANDLLDAGGAAFTSGQVSTDANGLIPLFSGPNNGTDVVYARVGSGGVSPVYARTGDRISAYATPLWRPNTAYLSGQSVLNPSGELVKALAGFTSGSSYNAANWSAPASATYARPAGRRLALIGDSRVAYEVANSGSATTQSELGPVNWALARMGQPCDLVANGGVSGETAAQVAARFATDALAYTPTDVYLQVGVNSATQNVTAASIQASLQSMIDATKNAGARLILATIAPNNGHTTAQRAVTNAVNNWIKTLSDPAVIVVDIASVVTNTAGDFDSAFTSDGLHQNPKGAARQGREIARVLGQMFPRRDLLPTGIPGSNLPNPLMAGTLGLGNSPTSWSFGGAAGGVTNLLARSDGKPGQWVELDTCDVVGGGQRYAQATGTVPSTATPGTSLYRAVVEIQTDQWETGTALQLYVQARNGSNTTVWTVTGLANSSPDPIGNADQPGLSPGTAVLATAEAVIPTGTASFNFVLEWTGRGKVRACSAAILTRG